MFNPAKFGILAAMFLSVAGTGRAGAVSVTVIPSAPSPAPVGTKVVFAATVAGTGSHVWFRFRVRRLGGDFQLIRDYSPVNWLEWTAGKYQGSYDIEIAARDLDSGEVGRGYSMFQFTSRVVGHQAVVWPTSNSLVFLYSAPACPPGDRMRVEFTDPGGVPSTLRRRRATASV